MPPATILPPLLPEAVARHRLDIPSDDAAEEKEDEHDAK